MGALYQVRRQQDPVNSLPWSDPKSNPLKDIQDAIAHYASDEVLRQNLEIECLLRELLGRLDDLRPNGQPTWPASNFIYGPKSLPVRYRAR